MKLCKTNRLTYKLYRPAKITFRLISQLLLAKRVGNVECIVRMRDRPTLIIKLNISLYISGANRCYTIPIIAFYDSHCDD